MLNQKENNVKIIVANWQMNGDFDFTYHYFKHLCECVLPDHLRLIICPPLQFINLGFRLLMEHEITQICLGAQCVSANTNTNNTGGVSATMLKECGAQVAFVYNNPNDNSNGKNTANEKVKNLIKENLCPIIGLSIDVTQGENSINDSISQQIQMFLQDIKTLDVLMVAFSIQNAETIDNVLLAQHISNISTIIHDCILKHHSIKNIYLLYEENINGANIKQIMANNDIDGIVLTNYSLQIHNFCETLEHL